MSKADLSNPIFHDEEKARVWLEAERWPDGPVCPFCNKRDHVKAAPMHSRPSKAHPEGFTQEGWYHCNACRKRFTVRVGTLYERSHIPLSKWLHATHLLCASKKGMSALQLHRLLGVARKTAWLMAHRIREGMRETNPGPMGGEGQTIEADETYYGNVRQSRRQWVFTNEIGWQMRGGNVFQNKIMSLVERGGRVRSVHVNALTICTVRAVLGRNALRQSDLMTGESRIYKQIGREFASHESVNHSIFEWGHGIVHTNTIEGYFALFKRGMRGIYQHCSEAHLHRYLVEFDFRYNHRKISDAQRATEEVRGIEGKRLTYRGTYKAANA
ncbi:MAG: IS1595 family transposase [Methyloceanibacter sp.]